MAFELIKELMNRARISKHAQLQIRQLVTLSLGLGVRVADLTLDSAFCIVGP